MKNRFCFIILCLIFSLVLSACEKASQKGDYTSLPEENLTSETDVYTTPEAEITTTAQSTSAAVSGTQTTVQDTTVTTTAEVTQVTSKVTTAETEPITVPVTTQKPEPPTTPEGYGLVPQSTAVNKNYFDDAAFIGDSISLKLKTYCLTGALGKADFFTVGSFSTIHALEPLTATSTHPSYQGQKMLVEDCIAACGAKKVYIMLGMNDISFGIDITVERYKTLVSRILAKSPDAKIFIQSMTPMRNDSKICGSKLNNDNIRIFNAKLLDACKEMGWYFIDVQSVMWDDAGKEMRLDYCSDPGPTNMGIHMTSSGCKAWVEYLLTHTIKNS